MATSVLGSVITQLISSLQGAGSLSGIRVFDGLEIDNTYVGDFISIGCDNVDSDEIINGSFRQEYKQLGAVTKFEYGTVNCLLASTDGTVDTASRRTQALTLLAAVENVIRADVSLGGIVIWSDFATGQMSTRQTAQGVGVLINFQITYQAKI